jgi:hypothetical protein
MDRVFESGASATPPSAPVSPSTGFPTGGNPSVAIPATKPGPYFYYQVAEELLAPIEMAGITPDHNVLTQLRDAIKRIAGAQVTAPITASRALTIADSGVVLVDATAGNVTLTLPEASTLAALGFTFVRIDTTANTTAIQRAGTDTIDGASTHPFDYFAPLQVLADGVSEWLRVGGVPAGSMGYWGNTTPPAGSLERNGAAVSRTTYKRLFAAIGTMYGAGDGINTFNLPDGRGEFDRGWDNGRGVDTGRVLGSAQGGAIQSHDHQINSIYSSIQNGAYSSGFGLFHDGENQPWRNGISSTGGTETRPRNVAHLPIIKY